MYKIPPDLNKLCSYCEKILEIVKNNRMYKNCVTLDYIYKCFIFLVSKEYPNYSIKNFGFEENENELKYFCKELMKLNQNEIKYYSKNSNIFSNIFSYILKNRRQVLDYYKEEHYALIGTIVYYINKEKAFLEREIKKTINNEFDYKKK